MFQESSNLFKRFLSPFIIKCSSAAGGFVLYLTIARLCGSEGVGTFAIAHSVYLGTCVFTKYGTDKTLLKEYGEYSPENGTSQQILKWSLTTSRTRSIIASAVILTFALLLKEISLNNQLASLLIWISFAIPAQTHTLVISGALKGMNKPALATYFETGSISVLTPISFSILVFYGAGSLPMAGACLAISSWINSFLIQQIHKPKLHLSNEDGTNQKTRIKQRKESANSFFTTDILIYLRQNLVIFLLLYFLDSEQLGYYKIAERVCTLIAFINAGLNAILPPFFSRLHRDGNIKELKNLARRGAFVGCILCAPPFILCMTSPQYVLIWFGAEFNNASTPLRIMVAAQAISALVGSVGFILSMTGHEKDNRNIIIQVTLFNLLAVAILVPFFGPTGAAIAVAASITAQNSLAAIAVTKRFGFIVYPKP